MTSPADKTPPVFSDEALARLKEICAGANDIISSPFTMGNLLARLEAAEECVSHDWGRMKHSGDCTQEAHTCLRCRYEAWLKSKSAGK